jgi:folate-binding Fe-S cluster repair protein YgfZ
MKKNFKFSKRVNYSTNYYEQFQINLKEKKGNFLLPNRKLFSIKGEDSKKFLQSYVSNDLNKMTKIMNCVFMNTKGRVFTF